VAPSGTWRASRLLRDMVPIQDVLHRIQWDPAWGGGLFEVGYLDRVAGTIVRAPVGELHLQGGAHASLTLRDDDGSVQQIPLHRIRRVWRDGSLIWERNPDDAPQ
jgi:uncharacterized protein (UPF0248 family)